MESIMSDITFKRVRPDEPRIYADGDYVGDV